MAVELCKVSLWMEALEPGRPLSFLDAHVKCGNSLVGASPSLVATGVPDDAFKPVAGDDRAVATGLRRRNRQQRSGQLVIDEDVKGLESLLASHVAAMEGVTDDSIAGVQDKEARFRALTGSPSYEQAKLLSDAWCVAFVAPMRCALDELVRGAFGQLAHGDALASDVREQIHEYVAEYRFFHWHLEFPSVFRSSDATPSAAAPHAPGFDLILGNPPFVNAIEGGVSEQIKRLVRFTHAYVGGTGDLAYYFLSAALMLVRPGGRVALVQPRAVLNATPAAGLRTHLPDGLRPNLLYAPGRSNFFAGASVFIALLVIGPELTCRVSRADTPTTGDWKTGAITTDNWWLGIERLLTDTEEPPEWGGPAVGDAFSVMASMTTSDAYDLVPYVADEQSGTAPKLVTTGLIDPEVCLWGQTKCRYLKRDFQFPRVHVSPSMTNSLRKRLERSERPKIIVAGLTKRIECFLDSEGEFIGAVSTYSIYHPDDDLTALAALCNDLLSDALTRRFTAELGGNAMGGGNITMKKAFLAALPYTSGARR